MKKFLDCISVVGSTPSRFQGKKKYVSTGAVATTEIDESEVVEVSYEDRPSRANLTAEAGDILFAKMQGTRKTLLLDSETEENIYSTGFYAVRANPEIITTECLYYLVDSELFLAQKDKNCSGATQKAITNGGLAKIEIRIPPLSEQAMLTEKLRSLTQLIADRKKQLELFDEVIKSRFIEMFESGNYPVCRLGDVCSKITDGTHKTPNYLDTGVTFISAKNIVNGELDFSDVKYISDQEYAEIQKRCQTEMGDILLSKSGSLGAPVIVKTTERIGLFESLAVIKYDRSKLLPAFLCEQLKSDRIQRQFKVGTKGVAIKHLHLGVIAGTDIVVPPIEDQNAFAAFVEQTDKSKFEIQKSFEKLEILKKSLVQQYFG